MVAERVARLISYLAGEATGPRAPEAHLTDQDALEHHKLSVEEKDHAVEEGAAGADAQQRMAEKTP